MNHKTTTELHAKGWLLEEFLEEIGYSKRWYYCQVDGNKFQKRRLSMLISALPEKG